MLGIHVQVALFEVGSAEGFVARHLHASEAGQDDAPGQYLSQGAEATGLFSTATRCLTINLVGATLGLAVDDSAPCERYCPGASSWPATGAHRRLGAHGARPCPRHFWWSMIQPTR